MTTKKINSNHKEVIEGGSFAQDTVVMDIENINITYFITTFIIPDSIWDADIVVMKLMI